MSGYSKKTIDNNNDVPFRDVFYIIKDAQKYNFSVFLR
jgi:hypothetical protein